jgi:predicted phosphodiesterase
MRLQVVSDLHLEFADTRIENTSCADVLILSGDICVADYFARSPSSPYHDVALRFYDFFGACADEFPDVIYVAGNHEFYDSRIEDGIDTLRGALADFTNIHILDDDYIDLHDHRFIGGTLWSNLSDPIAEMTVKNGMNDFYCITTGKTRRKIQPALTTQKHLDFLEFISKNLAKNTIVVGHHAPSYESICETYRSPGNHYLNFGYFTELSNFILERPEIKLWTHGHVHNSTDYLIGDTRVVCNPRGYCKKSGVNENANYDPSKVIEL